MSTIQEEELRRIRLFQSVELESIKGLIDSCSIRLLEKDEVLVRAGQGNRTVFFLLSGRVRVHLNSPESEPAAVLGPGESVAEMSVIDHQPVSAFVIAAEPTRLLAMDEEILWSLVQSSHAAAYNLLIALTARLRHADAFFGVSMEGDRDFRSLGTVDALTGLHNRTWLEKILERQVQRAMQGEQRLSVILIDIDHFRAFNERYGRVYGDHVLYAVAHTLSSNLRPSEIIARFEGDEFILLLPEVGIEVAGQIGERLHGAVMEAVPIMPDGKAIPHPTISVGLATLKPGQTGKELLAEANRALCRAKNGGRNCISE